MKNEEQISREFAVSEVRNMAFQFSDLYFTFVSELRERLGEEETIAHCHARSLSTCGGTCV